MKTINIGLALVLLLAFCSVGRGQDKLPSSSFQKKNSLGVNLGHLLTNSVTLHYERQITDRFALRGEIGYGPGHRKAVVDTHVNPWFSSGGITYERAKLRQMIALMPRWYRLRPTKKGGTKKMYKGLRLAYVVDRFENKCLDHSTISTSASFSEYGNFDRKKLKLHYVMGREHVLLKKGKSQLGLQWVLGLGAVHMRQNRHVVYLAGMNMCQKAKELYHSNPTAIIDTEAPLFTLSAHAGLDLIYRF